MPENTVEKTIVRETRMRDGLYYAATETILGGVPNQLVDIQTALEALGRGEGVGPARYLSVKTDVNVTVKINDVTATAILVTSTDPLVIPLYVMAIYRLYISHTGLCGAGAASAVIFAS